MTPPRTLSYRSVRPRDLMLAIFNWAKKQPGDLSENVASRLDLIGQEVSWDASLVWSFLHRDFGE